MKTISSRLKSMTKDLKKILKKYEVSGEDTKEILLMLQDTHYQWHCSATSARALEKILKNKVKFKDDRELIELYIPAVHEEETKYPFKCEELEDKNDR